jgi:hypothetical protein
MQGGSCGFCRYFLKDGALGAQNLRAGATGRCRRYPPQRSVAIAGNALLENCNYPQVPAAGPACGEFAPTAPAVEAGS